MPVGFVCTPTTTDSMGFFYAMKVNTIAFSTEDAEKYGIPCAILINGITLGLMLNKNKSTHIHDGKVWMYNSISDWCEVYPFMSSATIVRALKDLEAHGIIESAFHDRNKLNRTKWYTLTNAFYQNDKIPFSQNDKMEHSKMSESKQYKSNNNNQNNINQILIAGRLYERDELFELCWKAYPRKEGKAAARKTWGKLKVEDIQLIQVHLPLFKKESSAKEKRYIPHFSTYLNQRRFEDEVEPSNMGGILIDKINKLTNEIGHSLNNTLQINTNQ